MVRKKTPVKKTVKKAAQNTVKKPGSRAQRVVLPSFTVRTGKEITATFDDRIGLTAKLAAAVAAENVNILAATGYSASGFRDKATFTLVVDDIAKAERALDRIGALEIHESTVLMIETPNRVGALERIAEIIAGAGINIYYFYATTSHGATATTIIKTADDRKAVRALQKG